MRQLFIFIISLLPLSVYAETTFYLKEIKDVYIEEITSQNQSARIRFEVDYSNPEDTSDSLRSACWSSLEEMKTVFYSNGLTGYAETFSDGNIKLNASITKLTYFGGDNSITGYSFVTSMSGFNDKTWVLYCSIVTNDYGGGQKLFRPTTLSYTIVNLHASSMAYPHISAPAVIDLKSCSPNDDLEAVIPLTVGFVGYMGQSKNMELTVKSNDLPDDFDIVLDNQSILNKPPQVIQMPAGQKEKQIETHLKGKCPNQAGEYIWNAEYITTIQ